MSVDKNLLTAAALCSRLIKDNDLKYISFSLWHRLIHTLAENGILNPFEMLGCSEAKLTQMGLSADFAKRVAILLDKADDVEKTIAKLKSFGIELMGMDNENYPLSVLQRLQELSPPVLFFAGNASLINTESIAVIGSRNPSEKAKQFAAKLGKEIAKSGYTLVSGGAMGCDSISEYAATSENGNAVLYLAMPLIKKISTSRMEMLIKNDKICLISDHSPFESFNGGFAIARNRYIYSGAKCAVVCESGAETGGSWGGAIGCISGGYGNVLCYNNQECYGNQMLILKGATAIDCAEDVISFAIKA